MSKIKILLLTTALFALFLGCKYLDVNKKKVIKEYFIDLEKNLNKDILYDKYFYKEKKGGEGRSIKDIATYKDSLFTNVKSKIAGKKIILLSLSDARKTYKTYNFYSNYYDAQANNIYVCIIDNKVSQQSILYILMYGDKIVSLLPTKTIDGKIIQWF